MEKQILKNEPEHKREQILKDSCDKIEKNYTYLQSLSGDELTVKRENLSNNSIRLSVMEDELKEIKEEYKEKMKPLRDQVKSDITELKQKGIMITENVYLMYDEKEKMVCFYNKKGELVYERAMLPSEEQRTINMALRDGTNN